MSIVAPGGLVIHRPWATGIIGKQSRQERLDILGIGLEPDSSRYLGERSGEAAGTRETVIATNSKRPVEEAHARLRDFRSQFAHGASRAASNAVDDFEIAAAGEGTLPREHLMQEDTDGKEIDACIDRLRGNLLRRHVVGLAHAMADRSEVFTGVSPGDAKVDDLHRALMPEQHVLG